MKKKIVIIGVVTAMLFLSFAFLAKTQAASLTSVTDKTSKMKKNVLSNHEIQFTTPTGVAAGLTITVTFPSDFAPEAGIDYTDVDLLDDNVDLALGATASGATWGAAFGGTGNRTLTLTSGTGTIAAASVVKIKIGTNATFGATGDKQITNATSAGSYPVSIAGTFGDTGSFSLAIANEDQVVATGSVDPYLECDVTDGTVDFGTLSMTTVKNDTASMTAATNSKNGYSITVFGPTLTSGTFTIDAIGGTPTSSMPGTEQFGLRISASGGHGAAVYPYNQGSQYAFDAISGSDEVANSTQTSKTTTFTMIYLANIASDTEPGTYTATHTYVCTGNY